MDYEFLIIFLLCCVVVGLVFIASSVDKSPVDGMKKVLSYLAGILIFGLLLSIALILIVYFLVSLKLMKKDLVFKDMKLQMR